MKLAVFASGSGTNFEAIAKKIDVEILICDRLCPAIERAKRLEIPYHISKDENEILEILKKRDIQFIALAGYMRLIKNVLLNEYEGRIINIHPSLLPSFPGMTGIKDAFEYGVKITGVTVHYVDSGIDTGRVIAQVPIPIEESDTLEILTEKIHKQEHKLYPKILKELLKMTKKRALISVSDKTGIVEFAKALEENDYEIISTGGTFKTLKENGVNAIEVSEVTQFPEMLDGRVKTLHPKIHAGLLADLDLDTHVEQIENNKIRPISMVVVNLYPFKEAILKEEANLEDAIENIDIGGPSMLRSAAKNYKHVTVVTDPEDYKVILRELSKKGEVSFITKFRLASKVFSYTAAYDALISSYLGSCSDDKFTPTFEKHGNLRYGENPHQGAIFYRDPLAMYGIHKAEQLNGKELSYNNINDANAAYEAALQFVDPVCVAVKHMNPCGVAEANTIEEAYKKAYAADPVSIFGGIVALNRKVEKELAEELNKTFLEIVIAPSFSEEALEVFSKKPNLRVLKLDFILNFEEPRRMITSVMGGILVQDIDEDHIDYQDLEIPTIKKPSKEEEDCAKFAQTVVKFVKSNAIVVAKDNVTVGIGPGQTNRVGAAKIALENAGENAKGAVLASDAFFPMTDTIELAAKYGITTIIQPGGSIKDKEVIEACDRLQIAMIMTDTRHFKH